MSAEKDQSAVTTEPIIWYQASRYSIRITPVQVVSFTKKTVTIIERDWDPPSRCIRAREYFPTFEETKAEIVRREEYNLFIARRSVQRGIEGLAAAEALVKP